MVLGKNNLQTAQEWTKSYIKLIASYVHPKNSNHLRSHLGAIMEKKSGRIFLRSTSLLYKILPTDPGACKPTFYTICTSHLRWLWGTVFIIQPSDRMQYLTILQHKLHSFSSFNIQDDRGTRGLFKPLKNFQNRIRPAGSHFCSANCSECLNEHTRVTLQHNKEIIRFIQFY